MKDLHSEPHQTTLIKSKGTSMLDLQSAFKGQGHLENKCKNIYCEALRKTLEADPVRSNGCILVKTGEIIRMPGVLGNSNEGQPR